MKKPTKKVRLLAEHTHNNRTFRPGRILELNQGTADFLVRVGRGELADLPPSGPKQSPKRGARKPSRRRTPSPTPPTGPTE